MTFGLRVWDQAGNLTLDTGDRITRVLGLVSTGTSDGSTTLPFAAAGGTPWWSLIVTSAANTAQRPTVTRTGDTLAWAFSADGVPTDCKIIAGVY